MEKILTQREKTWYVTLNFILLIVNLKHIMILPSDKRRQNKIGKEIERNPVTSFEYWHTDVIEYCLGIETSNKRGRDTSSQTSQADENSDHVRRRLGVMKLRYEGYNILSKIDDKRSYTATSVFCSTEAVF